MVILIFFLLLFNVSWDDIVVSYLLQVDPDTAVI
jgi:hypothetical protein